MAAGSSLEFEDWLCKKLLSLDIDNDIYGSYITGILEENDEEETKKATLAEVLESMVEDSASLCEELISEWKDMKNQIVDVVEKKSNLDDIIAAHVGATKAQRIQSGETKSSEERDMIKQSVIAMYSSVNDESEDFDENSGQSAPKHHNTVDSALKVFQNDNAEKITQAEKQDRVKRKEESAKKKEQDKADRELQKIKKADRKEKEKKRTQKKERLR